MLFLYALVALLLLGGVGLYWNNVLKQITKKGNAEQDAKVELRTRELYTLQKMATKLNAAQNFDEAGQVIFRGC